LRLLRKWLKQEGYNKSMNLGWGANSIPELGWWVWLFLIWELVWKGLALWRAARNEHKWWFVAIMVVNSVGILPIVYLVWFAKRKMG